MRKPFTKNRKKKAIKLFLKAYTLCPDDPRINYNLGLAYYRYGNLIEAEKHLFKAVSKAKVNGKWLNLLAWVILEKGGSEKEALRYAKEAVKLLPDSPSTIHTLIRAYIENRMLLKALNSAHKAKKRWPKNRAIARIYNKAVDAYTAYYLRLAKEGKKEIAIKALEKIRFDPYVINAYCWLLYKTGHIEEALQNARDGKKSFPNSTALNKTFDQIMDRYIHTCYNLFKQGKRVEAITRIDNMKKKYPDHKALQVAYDRMFKAVLEEAETIEIPKPIKIVRRQEELNRESSKLIEELQGGIAQSGSVTLLSDVDRNIPRGTLKRPYGIAVIIGNRRYSKYGNGIPDVKYAERDAAYLKRYVTSVLGYDEANIIYETNLTQGGFTKIFGTKENPKGKLYNWVRPGQSEVFIYYVGHGAPDPKGKGAFLMPVDADPDYISTNGYSLDTFYKNLSLLPAKRITVVIDSCFSGNSEAGTLIKNISPAILMTTTPIKPLPKGTVFLSAEKDQVSHWYPEMSHSLFTYFFMKGLRGEADKNRDKTITVGELALYLRENVPYLARRLTGRDQNPIIKGEMDQVIARLR